MIIKPSRQLYIGPKSADCLQEYAFSDLRRKTELAIEYVSNAYVVPCGNEYDAPVGVYNQDGWLVTRSRTLRGAANQSNLISPEMRIKSFRANEGEIIEERAIFIGVIHGHYGHMITEGIARLWYCLGRGESLKRKFVFTQESDYSSSSLERFYEILGLMRIRKENILNVSKLTRFLSLTIPEPSIRFYDYFHDKYRETIESLIEESNRRKAPVSSRYLYISKSASMNGRAWNSEEIEHVFNEYGAKIVKPETLPLVDFISLLQGTSVLVASSGSASHNSIFMMSGARLICLNRSHHVHPLQLMINDMKEISCTYIDVYLFSGRGHFGDLPCFTFLSRRLRSWLSSEGIVYKRSILPCFPVVSFIKFSIVTLKIVLSRAIRFNWR